MKKWLKIQEEINKCKECGKDFDSSIGFIEGEKPEYFFIGMNPWVKEHVFINGRGITILRKKMQEYKIPYCFDNVVKCQIPQKTFFKKAAPKCLHFLLTQLFIIRPKYLITFGSDVNIFLGLHFDATSFSQVHNAGTYSKYFPSSIYKIYSVPHFSSILYPSAVFSEKKYYNELYKIIK